MQYDVKVTKDRRKAARLQKQGWELIHIEKSLIWATKFHLRRAK